MRRRRRHRKDQAPEHSAERRILDSACQLFYSQGLRAVGIDRVLEEAGAAKVSLYAHYPSKDDLVTAYLERQAEDWRARISAEVSPADDRARRHRAWVHELIRGLVASAGVHPEGVARALVVLYDGAIASAVLDSDPHAVSAARFAAERLLDG